MRNDTTRETRNTSLQIYIFPLNSPKFINRTIAANSSVIRQRVKLNEVSLFRIRAEIIANRLKYIVKNGSSALSRSFLIKDKGYLSISLHAIINNHRCNKA